MSSFIYPIFCIIYYRYNTKSIYYNNTIKARNYFLFIYINLFIKEILFSFRLHNSIISSIDKLIKYTIINKKNQIRFAN